MSHYVGDACQPLHGSMLADGYKDRPMTVSHTHRDGTPYEEQSHEGAGVHSAYETAMIDRYAEDLIALIDAEIAQANPYPNVNSGFGVALATVQLMDRSATAIPPKTLVDAFINAGATKTVKVYDTLWDQFGAETSQVMADGAKVLAMIWRSAWAAGNGQNISNTRLKAITPDRLIELYTDPQFAPSLDLDHIKPALNGA